MLIPEPLEPTEDVQPPAAGIEEEPKITSAGVHQPTESPTVFRGSSSATRKAAGAPIAPVGAAQLPGAAPGDVIDGFVLEEAIGIGGMGAVYRALDAKLDRQVALKLLPPDQANDPEIVQRFYQEGRSAARLDHENIARVFSIGQDGIYHFIAFEFIEGLTVRQRVEASGPLPAAEAVSIALQIAQALVHACERGVVHRDIKPSNIIITPHGRAKLVDMGLARRFERGGDHGLTQSGMTLGTFDYISPEQARDPRDVDVRSDLYSLGCTLFQMLTGRPPFPGGTVLQKLIQHQEEPPADVRTINPAVPAELAAITAKLMAKDRDRRYQTPEHLVRDLLMLASVMGLATTPRDLAPWIAEGHRRSWEHHLAWLLPALGFVIVVGGLAWWGSELSRPSAPAQVYGTQPGQGRAAGAALAPGALAANSGLSSAGGDTGSESSGALPAYPRSIPVTSNDDLLEVLATAPRRSVIVLADDGPYRLGGRSRPYRPAGALANLDVTIKAETGVRPLLKFAGDQRGSDLPAGALLHFAGGHVTIEGLEFELDVVAPEEVVAAVRAEDVELTVRGCAFRRTNSASGKNVAAIHVRAKNRADATGERPPQLLADSCHFDGGQAGVLVTGSADVLLRDCTMGPEGPSVWFDNLRSTMPLAGELRLVHTSILAAAEPVFRFEGSEVRVWVDDSVIATAARSPATLVLLDSPRNLSWRGRSNIYAGVGTYLALSASGRDERTERISDFSLWRESESELREAGSKAFSRSVWQRADPAQVLAQEKDNPTRAFLLNPSIVADTDAGARRGPFGSMLKIVKPASRAAQELDDFLPVPAREVGGEVLALNSPRPGEPKDAREKTEAEQASRAPKGDTSSPATQEDPMNLPSMPPMATPSDLAQGNAEPAVDAPRGGAAAAEKDRIEPPAPAAREAREPARPVRKGPTLPEDEDLIRGSEQFMSMFGRLSNRGGRLRIAAGAELELPTLTLGRTAQYEIVAEPGAARPRLRFRPEAASSRSPAEWSVMFNVRAGSLYLQGLDVVLANGEMQHSERLAAAGLVGGAQLTLSDCTFTVAVSRPGCAVFVVQPQIGPATTQPSGGAASRAAVVRMRDSFLRSGGDGVTVAAGRRLELDLANVLVSTEGSLLHAFGGLRQKRAEFPAVKVLIDHVTARVKGGLVHLDSTPDDPELATAAIVAQNSIMSTANRDDPLLRLDGRDQLEDLGDKIRWESHKVAYDRIKTYRRDEVARTGIVPRIYDRANWTSAFLPRDEAPVLGDVRFLREVDASQAAWKLDRDDLRIAPASPAADTGPDLGRIPQAPPSSEI